MKKKWNIADLIDLEFFLNQDSDEDLDSLTARDRKIYSELPSALKKATLPLLSYSALGLLPAGQDRPCFPDKAGRKFSGFSAVLLC